MQASPAPARVRINQARNTVPVSAAFDEGGCFTSVIPPPVCGSYKREASGSVSTPLDQQDVSHQDISRFETRRQSEPIGLKAERCTLIRLMPAVSLPPAKGFYESRLFRFTGRQAFLLERTRPPPMVFTKHESRNTNHGFYPNCLCVLGIRSRGPRRCRISAAPLAVF